MACAYITDLATNIWKDLGEPTDITSSYIQSKLVSEYFIGKLNIVLPASYTISAGDIVPALGATEQAIYALLYKSEHYSTKITRTMGGYTVADMWIELSDGDGKVRRASPTEFIKILRDLKTSIDQDLRNMIGTYRMNASTSQTVDYVTIEKSTKPNEYRLGDSRTI